ncbi:hypothetical protein DESC_490022 [Desulfosarcina cetonica]|nr:hypothetical protein DESC_490022 [Desulfosarcina cetonica]
MSAGVEPDPQFFKEREHQHLYAKT